MNTAVKNLVKAGIRAASAGWNPYSRLVLVGDALNWSLDHDRREIGGLAKQLGIQTVPAFWRFSATPQAQLYFSHYTLVEDTHWLESNHRIGITFPEGVPPAELKEKHPVFQAIRRHPERLTRIQVSHQAMRNYLLETGIEPEKVFVIPIAVNLTHFRYRDEALRRSLRTKLGIPAKAFVIGSFQKDGTGWDDGLEPKLVKGPDIFLQTLEKLKPVIPELHVLLLGPARGYVKAGLERLGIPYTWLKKQPYAETCRAYTALDLYLVTSRQEGGPKALLEAMAAGVPLVSTRVGQAVELVKSGKNGWLAEVANVDELTGLAWQVYANRGKATLDRMLENGRATAEANTYASQLPLWRSFMQGFVEW